MGSVVFGLKNPSILLQVSLIFSFFFYICTEVGLFILDLFQSCSLSNCRYEIIHMQLRVQ